MSLGAETLLGGHKLRFVASGDTYMHRNELTSWGWHYDPERRVWIEDNGSEPDDICILAIRDLPGIVVTEE
jgi:hypothetical protein